MNVRRSLVYVLVVCLAVNLVPVGAWAAEREAGPAMAVESVPATPVVDFRAAVRNAVVTLETPAVVSPQPIAAAAPAATRAAVRRRQGGGAGMVIGLVSMVAGLAMTYYMVKEMNKNKDEVE